tara:strand:+ start:438 stop:2837 length:2400 start_codon:yes stop_codon:yes gene_type:complete
MRNKILSLFCVVFIYTPIFADNLKIESENIELNKKNQISIFRNNVIIETPKNNIIKSEYAEYNKKNKKIILKQNIFVKDIYNNIIETNYADYDEVKDVFISKGDTKITTTKKFVITSKNIIFDNKNKTIKSNSKSVLTDVDGNIITVSNFEYQSQNNIFKSIGNIKILDKFKNNYEFSQIYIDTEKKEVVGTDVAAFINNDEFKLNKDNKPRILSNTVNIKNEKLEFKKSVFTNCNYRKKDKCPPWSIKSSKIIHDNKKKTIYYDNAVLKIYDIPIFYSPKFSHPDPSVERRSGFLSPSYSNSKNLGQAIKLPYFFAINKDKDLTLNTRLYSSENPLFLSEYRQAFKNSNAFLDFGFTEGYKKTSDTKKEGDKSHFFARILHNFKSDGGAKSSLELNLQEVSDDKYFKLYKINTDLIEEDVMKLENSVNFKFEKDDLYLNFSAGAYETLASTYNDKFEYIYPEIELRKNLINNIQVGNIDLESNFKILNQDTNKTSKYLVNNIDWDFKNFNFNSGVRGQLISKIKNVNYETKNIDNRKNDPTNELFGAFGYFSEIDLIKETGNSSKHYLKPKALLRYSPGQMKKEIDGNRLYLSDVFSLNRSSKNENFENGLNLGIGFDYEIDNKNYDFNLSMGQVLNEKENRKMSSISSLDEKISDLVGESSIKINENLKLNYNFLIDQNYQDFNYNEISTEVDFDVFNIELNYIEERKHVGNANYASAELNYSINESSKFNIVSKRNLVSNSSEYYDLSYQYFNDCLKAGLVFRREFYQDSELEPEDSLMFRISIFPDTGDKDQLLN